MERSQPRGAPRIAFDDRAAGRLVITTRVYRLTLSKRNGKILSLVDRASGARLAANTNRCLWGVATESAGSYRRRLLVCAKRCPPFLVHAGTGRRRPLTLTYRGSAVVTVHGLQPSSTCGCESRIMALR